MASGPIKAMAAITSLPENELSRPKMASLVLRDVLQCVDAVWVKRRPWGDGNINPHELACQICLWVRSGMGEAVTKIKAISEAML